MTYGIEVKNENNEVIIDSNFPAYFLFQEVTVSGVASVNNLFRYDFSTIPAFPAFVQVDVGDFFGANPAGYWSFKSSLTFKAIKTADEMPDPTGYGAIAYNSSGIKTWFANGPAVVLKDFFTISVNGSYTTDADWVSILTRLPMSRPVGLNQRLNVIQGVERTSTSEYIWTGRDAGFAPNFEVGPWPLSCLFAKSI